MNNINNTLRKSYLAKSILTIMTSSILFGCNAPSDDTDVPIEKNDAIKVYFKSTSDNYDNASLYVWNDDACGAYAGDTSEASD